MITRGATDHASAHNSPSSRADTAPSDNEDPEATAAVADVVDVTGADEPWGAVPARRTTKPTPLRPSKRAPEKAVTGAALAEARKGKKRLKARKAPAVVKVRARETPPEPKRTTRADGGFDLGAFMASFEPGAPSADTIPHGATMPAVDSPASTRAAPMGAEMATQLRAMVVSQPHALSPTALAPSFVSSASTAPNAKGEMSPGEVCYLTTASFPEGAKKGKCDYNPPQAHLLAACRMFRGFGTEIGKTLSAMSFVFWKRELESVKFQVTPTVLMAIFSGHLGSRGLTLMHFKEFSEIASLEDGSTNANFSSDFSPSASLPPATIRCATYEDILDGLHGLSALGQDVWYDYMRKLTSRLRIFGTRNKSADPGNTPARVRLTLLYANKFIGATLGYLQADDPQWWSGFSEALRGIEYQSPVWTMALVGVLTQEKDVGLPDAAPRGSRDSGRRETARRLVIPDAIRRLIPINRKGQEPCLLNVAGLPSRLLEWIERTYGGCQAQHKGRR
ncbi:hypothetical protein G195_011280 [Phytophthora kernoviae 00238/432]|uniref:Uncharacterized protein n=1 Tax=Phytophthora kernoviae 00238/432 TaxID=1284355 RepID=A0A8J4VZM3_9STRA|nr:hypothetical protein G195_011280 [Phytophthora kernoviae 00238/432]